VVHGLRVGGVLHPRQTPRDARAVQLVLRQSEPLHMLRACVVLLGKRRQHTFVNLRNGRAICSGPSGVGTVAVPFMHASPSTPLPPASRRINVSACRCQIIGLYQ
jgi:hypothetical protein